MPTIAELCSRLYAERTRSVLYHYTSLSGLEAIIESRTIWASEIRYLNDAAEMHHTAAVLREEIEKRLRQGTGSKELLERFREWILDRLVNGNMLFVVSFTTNGNLLSQWRGYGNVGKGVSLGFAPGAVYDCAELQGFEVGRCIYDEATQRRIAQGVVTALERSAAKAADREAERLFVSLEGDLLRIATLLKHPSFKEEDEWRVVSPVLSEDSEDRVCYREGISMLVPYIKFGLDCTTKLQFEHIVLGPTPNITLSMSSLARFLARHGSCPRQGISYCDIPYRKW